MTKEISLSLVSRKKRTNAFGVLWRKLWSNQWAKVRFIKNTWISVFRFCCCSLGTIFAPLSAPKCGWITCL